MPATGAPLGSPFGSGVPAEVAPPALGAGMSRYIDPSNGTYVLNDATGRYGTMPIVRQRVLLALRHIQDSSTAIPKGIKWPRKQGAAFEREVDDTIRSALYSLTNTDKLATLDEVLVERLGTGRAQVTVSYTDLTTNEPESVSYEF